MKKFTIALVILLLIGAGYFIYEKWVKHAHLTAWDFIPKNFVMVFEVGLLKDYTALKGYPVWKTLRKTPEFGKIDEGIEFLDSINGKGGFVAIFKKAPVLISAHKTSNSELDFLFVLDIQNTSQNTFVNIAIDRLRNKGYKFKTRNYNGFKISEILKDSKLFTYSFYKNYFLASFTPYLVEDAIRTMTEGEPTSFKDESPPAEDLQPVGLFKVFVNYEQIENLLSEITSKDIAIPLKSGQYAVTIDSGFVHLLGISDAGEEWMNINKGQPTAFDMKEIIPENTKYMYHITSSEIPIWKEKQIAYIRSNEPEIKQYQDSLKRAFDFNVDQVLDLVDDEIGIVSLETGSPRDEHKLCILKVKDINQSLDFFRRLSERISLSLGDSIYSQSYGDNEVRFFPLRDFPKTFLGSLAEAFDQCFYINYRNYIIFSNNLQELNNLIPAIQNESTWGKSLRINEFLEQVNNTANVSLFINIPRTWDTINDGLKKSWGEHFKTTTRAYKSFEFMAFQFSYLNNQFFTNFMFTQPKKNAKSVPRASANVKVQFAGSLITKPFLVRTHSHPDFDIIVQNDTHSIYYLDRGQSIQWSKELEGPIISNIYPVDYYKNGKLQYAFATSSSVHIWDKTGKPIPGFPKSLPQKTTIAHFNVIDYNQDRNYRMAITDLDGNTYLTDKNVKFLEGWNPKKFDRGALTPLSHFRLIRNDIMVSISEGGVINVMNRKGQQKKGFPFDTKQSLDKNYFLHISSGLSESSLSCISKGGELIRITLDGKVIKRNQLLKKTADAEFRLVPDKYGKSFLIVKKEGNDYEVQDDSGNFLFNKNYPSNEPVLVQYYRFGAGKDLIAFTDTANESSHIYDKSGDPVIKASISSSHEISVIQSKETKGFRIYTTWGSNMALYHFNY